MEKQRKTWEKNNINIILLHILSTWTCIYSKSKAQNIRLLVAIYFGSKTEKKEEKTNCAQQWSENKHKQLDTFTHRYVCFSQPLRVYNNNNKFVDSRNEKSNRK